MEQESFKYYAFISYSHKDQIIAKKLQNSLEHYYLPSALLKTHPNLPKNLTPVFMDESDVVAVGSLKDTLETYLGKSNYLIVICSPNSTQSPYVNDEIKYFIEKGRIGRIVLLIIMVQSRRKNCMGNSEQQSGLSREDSLCSCRQDCGRKHWMLS